MEENRELTKSGACGAGCKGMLQAGSELFGMCDDGISESF